MKLNEIDAFLQKAVSEKKKNLEPFAAKKFAEIKHLLKQTDSLLNSLEAKHVENENPKLEKIVETSKRHSLRQLSALLEKLSPPTLQDLGIVRKYCIDSSLLLAEEIPAFGKNVAYTSIVLKEDMRHIGASINELQKIFLELNNEFSKNKLVFLGSIVIEEKEKIIENQKKAIELNSKIAVLSEEIFSIKKLEKELGTQLDSMRNSEEAKKLFALEGQKNSLLQQKESLNQSIFEKASSVEKPLKKLSKLVEAKKILTPKIQEHFLKEFLQNPLLALKRDPKGDFFKEILKELEKQLSSGNIELKQKELEKKLALTKELIEFNFFDNFFWKANNIEIELTKIEKEILRLGFSKKILEKEKNQEEAKIALGEKSALLENEKKKIEKAIEEKNLLVQNIESLLSEIAANAKIKIAP